MIIFISNHCTLISCTLLRYEKYAPQHAKSSVKCRNSPATNDEKWKLRRLFRTSDYDRLIAWKASSFFHYPINTGYVIIKGIVVTGSWIRYNEASTGRMVWKRREVLSGKTLRKIACYDYDIGCRCIYAIRQPSRSTKDARWIIKFLVPAASRALWVFILILHESQRELI